jgi:CPA1 family monovalent cation:H+ antiporter
MLHRSVLPRRDLLRVLQPVLLLALGLVVLTVVVVGYFIHWLVPQMPLAVAGVTAGEVAISFVLLSGGGVLVGLVVEWLGLQLRHMLAAVAHYDVAWLALLAVSLWAQLMALRIGWVWASAHVRFWADWGWGGLKTGPDWRRNFLVSRAAVRGSVTLATALSGPLLTSAGSAFPERELVVFLAAATIVLTLALKGIPLPWLIVRLKAPSEAQGLPEENSARAEIARAGADAVRPVLRTLSDPSQRTFVEQLIHRYEGKITLREADAERVAEKAGHIAYARAVRLTGIAAEREALYRLHARDAIHDETLRVIEEELDAYEMLSSASPLRG